MGGASLIQTDHVHVVWTFLEKSRAMVGAGDFLTRVIYLVKWEGFV